MTRLCLLLAVIFIPIEASASDFEKCMSTEVHRAKEGLQLEQKKVARALEDRIKLVHALEILRKEQEEWSEWSAFVDYINPLNDALFKSLCDPEDWKCASNKLFKHPEFIARNEKLDDLYKATMTKLGYEGSEPTAWYIKFFAPFEESHLNSNKLLRLRGEEEGFCPPAQCERPFVGWEYKMKNSGEELPLVLSSRDLFSPIRFIEESLVWADQFSATGMKAKAEKIAELACNKNGIYR